MIIEYHALQCRKQDAVISNRKRVKKEKFIFFGTFLLMTVETDQSTLLGTISKEIG